MKKEDTSKQTAPLLQETKSSFCSSFPTTRFIGKLDENKGVDIVESVLQNTFKSRETKKYQEPVSQSIASPPQNLLPDFPPNTPIIITVEEWLKQTPNETTRLSYASTIQTLFRNHPIQINAPISLLTQDKIEEGIENFLASNSYSSIGTIEHHIRCFFAFFKFLETCTKGDTQIGIALKEKIQSKVSNLNERLQSKKLLDQASLNLFMENIYALNPRDACIAYLLIRTGKHPLNIIQSKKEDFLIDQDRLTIKDLSGKFITLNPKNGFPLYHKKIIANLKSLLKSDNKFCFTTKQGKIIQLSQIKRSFEMVGKKMNLPFRITPKILQNCYPPK